MIHEEINSKIRLLYLLHYSSATGHYIFVNVTLYFPQNHLKILKVLYETLFQMVTFASSTGENAHDSLTLRFRHLGLDLIELWQT